MVTLFHELLVAAAHFLYSSRLIRPTRDHIRAHADEQFGQLVAHRQAHASRGHRCRHVHLLDSLTISTVEHLLIKRLQWRRRLLSRVQLIIGVEAARLSDVNETLIRLAAIQQKTTDGGGKRARQR